MVALRKYFKSDKYAAKYAISMKIQVLFVSNADFKIQTRSVRILEFSYLEKCILEFSYLESSMLKSAFETNHTWTMHTWFFVHTWKCILDFWHDTWFWHTCYQVLSSLHLRQIILQVCNVKSAYLHTCIEYAKVQSIDLLCQTSTDMNLWSYLESGKLKWMHHLYIFGNLINWDLAIIWNLSFYILFICCNYVL